MRISDWSSDVCSSDLVPPNLIRKMHGPALSADALNKAIDAGVRDLMAKEKLRPALQPAVTLADGYETGKDAEVTVALEVLPEIRSEEHTYELPSLRRLSYAVLCLKKTNN